MWVKIFAAVLSFAASIMAFLTYYSWTWLQSIGSPGRAYDGYHYYALFAAICLLISTGLLLLLANVVFWRTKKLWPLWVTFAYASAFISLWSFWLAEAGAAFLTKHQGPLLDGVVFKPAFGVMMIVVMAAVIFANQLTIIRCRGKAYPEPIFIAGSKGVKLP